MLHDFDRFMLNVTAHRPWPLPDTPWIMTQSWNDLLFAHWRVDPAQVRRLVPRAFDLDLFHGEAWIGVVPFRMSNVGVRDLPGVPGLSAFPELNVRTYVRVSGRPGIYFFSLDAGSRVAVWAARALLNLPYYTAAMSVETQDATVDYASARRGRLAAEFRASYGATGAPFVAAPGSREHFLTERYCLYHVDRRGDPYRLDIHHLPWSLQRAHASIASKTVADAAGFKLDGPPLHLLYARRQDVVAWWPTQITGSDAARNGLRIPA